MTFFLGKTTLRVHPLLPALWLGSLFGGSGVMLPALLALLLHESGHFLAARAFRLSVEEMEITPMGGVISIENLSAVAPFKAFLLAAAGPLFSMMGFALSPVLYHLGASFSFLQCFSRANLLLALMNLLPVLPLDGGRMLRAVLSKKVSFARSTRLLTTLGSITGVGLCALSFVFSLRGRLSLSPAFAGLYLLYAAALEGRQGTARYMTALIARREKLERHQVLPVECLAAGGDLPLGLLLRRMHPGKYHMVFVLTPDGMGRIGTLEEGALCEVLLHDSTQTLETCIKKGPASAARPNA